MKIPEINTVCFIGAGTMGCANAITAGLAGYKINIYDLSSASIESVPIRFKEIGDYIVQQGMRPPILLWPIRVQTLDIDCDIAQSMSS